MENGGAILQPLGSAPHRLWRQHSRGFEKRLFEPPPLSGQETGRHAGNLTIHPRFDSGPDKDNAVERIATWHKKHSFTFVRRERHEGKNIAIFESTSSKRVRKEQSGQVCPSATLRREFEVKMRLLGSIWTPHCPYASSITNSSPRIPRITAESGPYGLRLRDFMSPAAQHTKAAGWVELQDGEPRVIWDDFKWNAPVDTSLFGLNPPTDYTIQRIPETKVTDGKPLFQNLTPRGSL